MLQRIPPVSPIVVASPIPSGNVTFLFTDIEGSTRLWEQEPGRMPLALARHDALARAAVESNHGVVVKTVGDGLHAAFAEPLDALNATLAMQQALTDAGATNGVALRVRCGLHVGAVERRDNDYFGSPVNRAARIMGAAHGGQVLLSQAVVDCVSEHLPSACYMRDLGRVRLKDLATPERVYQLVHPQLRQDFPALRSLEATPNNLPQQISSFIGREHELSEAKRLLTQSRLVTLVGIGGIGKTRLSLQMAADTLDAYPDGVWLVELGSITDPLLVATSVAQVLGVQERRGTPLMQTLCSHLKSRCLLLVLDNCEHLIKACAALAEALLTAAPTIRILASSREPLRLAGEQIYPLPTLSLPAPQAGQDGLARAEAVQLFVERARLQQPGFVLTQPQSPTVAALCVHLDGIPLALELAAARVGSLSIEEINARLRDRFRLLTGGTRSALPRQQTLRATLDWSYDLLGEHERVVLPRLAIFAGFTLEAASAVASNPAIDEFEVIDLVLQLVARSLVVADTSDAGTRYRLLETTREYALEKLAESKETEMVRRRHAQYFRDFLQRAPDDWLRMSDSDWHAAYLPERDNVRTALDWSLDPDGESALGVALAGSSGPMWLELSLLGEGRELLDSALSYVTSATTQLDHARLLLWLGMLWDQEGLEKALAAAEAAIVSYRRLNDPLGLGYALVILGRLLRHAGRFEEAIRVFAEAFPLLRSTGVPKAVARYYFEFGALTRMGEDPNAAKRLFEEAFRLYRNAGAEGMALFMLVCVADLSWELGELEGALAAFRDSAALMRKQAVVPKYSLATAMMNMAAVHTERGEFDEALRAGREGLPLLEEIGVGCRQLDHLALRAALIGKLEDAARITGFADAALAQKHELREPNEARARHRLQEVLSEQLPADELERLFNEGKKMTEHETCRLALEE